MGLLKDTGYIMASSGVNLFTSLASGILTARLLGPFGKGELYLVIQAASLAALFLAGGLGASYQYHLTKKRFDRSTIVLHMLMHLGVVVLLLAGALTLGKPLVRMVLSPLPRSLILLTFLAVVLNIEILVGNSILASFPNGIRRGSFLAILSSVSNVLALVMLIWVLRWTVLGGVLAYIAGLVVRVVPTLWMITAGTDLRLNATWATSGLLLRYGGSVLFSSLMVTSLFRIDVFLVSSMTGTAALGVYSVAVAFAELALMCPNALGAALFKHLPASEADEQIRVLCHSSRMIGAIGFVTGAGVTMMSYPLVVGFMGHRFAGAVVPLCLLVPGVIAMSVNYVFANYYAAGGQPLVTGKCFGSGLLLNLAINLLLIPRWGIRGAAIASSFAYTLVTVMFTIRLRREHGLRLAELFLPRREDLAGLIERLQLGGDRKLHKAVLVRP
jgi:O-antigen/teichoic acid export membrane protein